MVSVGVEQKLPQVFNIMILHSQNLEKKINKSFLQIAAMVTKSKKQRGCCAGSPGKVRPGDTVLPCGRCKASQLK